MTYKIIPLVERFKDPINPVHVEIRHNGREIKEVVLFEHDRINGKFNFGKLQGLVDRLSTVNQNTLKTDIKKSVFEEREIINKLF